MLCICLILALKYTFSQFPTLLHVRSCPIVKVSCFWEISKYFFTTVSSVFEQLSVVILADFLSNSFLEISYVLFLSVVKVIMSCCKFYKSLSYCISYTLVCESFVEMDFLNSDDLSLKYLSGFF